MRNENELTVVVIKYPTSEKSNLSHFWNANRHAARRRRQKAKKKPSKQREDRVSLCRQIELRVFLPNPFAQSAFNCCSNIELSPRHGIHFARSLEMNSRTRARNISLVTLFTGIQETNLYQLPTREDEE